MKWKVALLATAAAAILVGCGGGGADSTSQRAGITSVKVMGDSLSDSGVFTGLPGFGRIFSVQGSSSEPNALWTERITALLGAPQLCNFFKFTGATFVPNPTPGCTSFAVGGGASTTLMCRQALALHRCQSPTNCKLLLQQAITKAQTFS